MKLVLTRGQSTMEIGGHEGNIAYHISDYVESDLLTIYSPNEVIKNTFQKLKLLLRSLILK